MTIWIERAAVLLMHDEQLAQHGGASGVRDADLLESALARPLNLAGYGEPDVAAIGAMYAIAIARNHPFIDGNKRAGFMAMVVFLSLNGQPLEAPEAEAIIAMLDMASGELGEDGFTAWVREHSRPGPA
jgi:death-on-curing protein